METNLTEVYLDNSATSRCSERAKDLMVKVLMEDYGNPSSLHMKGVEAENYIKEAKKKIAKTLKVDEKEILFTSGGTESNNTALIGAALANKRAGNHIITTSIEHASVSAVTGYLEELGFRVTYLKVDADGIISLDELREAVCKDTILVSMMMVNNEIGTVQPIKEIAKIAKAHKILFHTDAVQAFGHIPLNVEQMHIDLLSVSAHKFHGPKGVGFLYIRKGLKLRSFIHGGAQERGKRGGTEDIPGICGAAAAFDEACATIEQNAAYLTPLRDRLIAGLTAIPHTALNGDSARRLPGNVNVCFEGIEGESLLLLLDEKGIAASSGSACTSGSLDPSHVLLALGRPHEVAHGSLRLSLSHENRPEEIDYILEVLPGIVSYLRGMSPVWDELETGLRPHLI